MSLTTIGTDQIISYFCGLKKTSLKIIKII
jgi:hypothetical protein